MLLKYSVNLNILSLYVCFFPFSGKLVTVLIDETTRTKTFSYDLCLYDDTLVVPRKDKSVVIYKITYWIYMTGLMTINLMHDLLIGEMSGESLLGSYNWISLSNRHLRGAPFNKLCLWSKHTIQILRSTQTECEYWPA